MPSDVHEHILETHVQGCRGIKGLAPKDEHQRSRKVRSKARLFSALDIYLFFLECGDGWNLITS